MAKVRELKECADPSKVDSSVYLTPEIVRAAEKIDWLSESIRFKKVREFANAKYRDLREANPGQAFAQLFRAGVQTVANAWYQRTPVDHPKYFQEVTSDKRQEFHAPLYDADIPTETGAGEPYSETAIAGQDIEIINRKFMGGESFSREMFDDDQTGQIKQRMGKLGKGMAILEEIWAAGMLLGSGLTVGKTVVPSSGYTTKNPLGTTISTVYSTALYAAASGNRPSTYVQFGAGALATAYEALLNATDPLGVKIEAVPDMLVVSSFDALNVRRILNSQWYPAVQGSQANGDTFNTAGSSINAGQMADNVLKGLTDYAVNRYLPRGAWFLGKAHQGPVFQRRDPLEVVQEVPNSGQSFQTDTIRYRSRARWMFEWIESRFWYCGNPGTGQSGAASLVGQ
jgi:hypothetical protein